MANCLLEHHAEPDQGRREEEQQDVGESLLHAVTQSGCMPVRSVGVFGSGDIVLSAALRGFAVSTGTQIGVGVWASLVPALSWRVKAGHPAKGSKGEGTERRGREGHAEGAEKRGRGGWHAYAASKTRFMHGFEFGEPA